jgi:hypothetical protein
MKFSLPRIRFLESQLGGLKAFFMSRLFREKLLLLAFILMIAATWFSSVMGRVGRWSKEFRQTSNDLSYQRGWLVQQASIEANAKAAVEHFEPSKTFDGMRLQGEIDAIARRTGLSNYSAENVQTDRTAQFSMNSMRLEIRNADYASLVKFYLEVAKQAPYIGIEQFRITASNNKHNASLRVTSFEIVK